jgi:hypothetical protein
MKNCFKMAAALVTFGPLFAYAATPATSGSWQSLITGAPSLPLIRQGELVGIARNEMAASLNRRPFPHAIDPREFGATVGPSDSSAAVQAAINSLCSAGGGLLRFSVGEYTLHDVNVGCSSVIITGASPGPSKAGTVINYSSATDHAFRFRNPSFPHITQGGWLYGNGVENLTFYSSGGSTRALDFDGFYGCFVRNVFLTGSVHDGVKLYGGYKCDIEEVSTSGHVKGIVTNSVVQVQGSAGQNSSGGFCELASCSTGVDLVSLRNVAAYGTSGTGINIKGFVDTTAGEHIAINGMTNGLSVQCPPGFLDISYCLAFITFTDFEAEGATETPITITDATDFQCYGCYSYGGANTTGYALYVYLANYSTHGAFGQGLRWIGGRISGAQLACAAVGISDTHISDAYIYQCNMAGGNHPGTLYTAGSQHFESNNQYCMINGTVPSPMAGTQVTAPASKAQFSSNAYWACASGLTTTGSPSDVAGVNLQGP